jgi:hypothetical protein
MMPNKDIGIFMPLLEANGALVLEGVAGIGKTHSIKDVRERLSESFDVKALETLLGTVKRKSSGTAHGNDLTGALKEAQNDPEGQKANVCRRIDAVVAILVMHPSTSYEEMIGGLRPAPGTGSGTTFTWQPGKLTRAIAAACRDLQPGGQCRNHLIVLDEINRCNLPSVLGELIYLIEPSRRVDWDIYEKAKASGDEAVFLRDNGYSIRLRPEPHIYPDSGETPPQDSPDKRASGSGDAPTNGSGDEPTDLFIPSNLFFLGTMNSSDRSILGFDQALRRRFPPYRLEPMTKDELLNEVGKPDANSPEGKGIAAWSALNVLLRFAIGPDAMIGHSYWFNARKDGGDKDACGRAWRFGVLPQAIHSAESARMERFLADLFKAASDKAEADEAEAEAAFSPDGKSPAKKIAPEAADSKKETSWDRFISDYLKSRDTFEKDLSEAFEACDPGALQKSIDAVPALLGSIGKMSPKVRLVGSGHGEKLVITDK